MTTTDALARDPSWLPYAYAEAQDSFVLAHLPRESQRRAVFLDKRYVADAPLSPPVPAAALKAAAGAQGDAFSHFIFHTAFCCSTLLARALDVPGAVMCLKEPSVLMSLSVPAAERRDTPSIRSALATALDLLARPLVAGEQQVIKASNLYNVLIPAALDHRAESKAIFMYGSLEAFVRSSAKRGVFGRAFSRRLYTHFAPTLSLNTGLRPNDIFELTDLQVAALVWLMEAKQLAELAQRYAGRVRFLDSERFLAKPLDTMTRVSAFFALGVNEPTWRAIVEGPVFASDAKNHDAPFDAQKRREQHRSAAAAHAEELSVALKWAEALAQHSGAPMKLGDTL